ncbi:MAG: polysaccharide deacetylase family protein [Pseudomonadota bacterium]
MPGALCLTYDDLYVTNWVAARHIFQEFDACVTFCISHMHTANDEQIKGLHLLQDDGHEIAYHTRTHPKFGKYLRTHGLEDWLENEIDKGIEEHRALGFPAKSFASPFHSSSKESRAACVERFEVIRANGPRGVNSKNATRRIYNQTKRHKTVNCLGFADMQKSGSPSWERQTQLLDLLVEHEGAGVFAGHNIRATKRKGPGMYSSHRQLHRILRLASDRGIKFITLSEFANGG